MFELVSFYPDWNFEWFLRINSQWSNGFLDLVLPILRHKLTWIPLYILIAGFLIKTHKWDGLWAIIFVLISFAISNTLSAEILKPIYKIDRPCNDPDFKDEVTLRVHCGGGKSFPSAHATNHFALSLVLGVMLFKKYKWTLLPLLIWAGLVSYAQVYVGVHYPVDVLVGAAIGTLIGVLLGFTFNKMVRL